MIPSNNCYEFIKQWEGLYLAAYDDGGGVWTIGWGTTFYHDGTPVKKGDTITKEQAQEYLEYDVNNAAESVTMVIKEVPANQNQFDSLTSFEYNTGGLRGSTLLKKFLVNPHDPTIYKYRVEDSGPVVDSCEFLRWVRDNGKIIKGLINRRVAEADLYISSSL